MSRTGRSLLTKDQLAPEEVQAIEQFIREFGRDAVDPLREDLVAAVRVGEIDLADLEAIEAAVEETMGEYTNDFDVVFREGTVRGGEVGRALAARRYDLDVVFGRLPRRTLDELETFASEVRPEVTDRLTGDISNFLRSVHEEGLSIDEAARRLNDEYLEQRVKGWEARRIARTQTIPSSNAGAHSAHEDSGQVVAEEWLATNDDDTRDSHMATDGQIVPVDGTFILGSGVEVRYPGDPRAPLEEIVNERCSVAPVIADQLSADELATIEAGDRLY